MEVDVLRRKKLGTGCSGEKQWHEAEDEEQLMRRAMDDAGGGWWWWTWGRGIGGHTVDKVLTIPWVISQLSMGSSWSAGLSSPFTLSWINNRITPYTREERPHHSIAHSAERETEEKSNVQKTTVIEKDGTKEENLRKRWRIIPERWKWGNQRRKKTLNFVKKCHLR